MRIRLTKAYQKQNINHTSLYVILLLSIVLAVSLCIFHVSGSTVAVLMVLFGYLVCLAFACLQNMTLPMLLFFLPWSPLMRTSPTSFSFFTFGLVLVCAIRFVKGGLRLKGYQLITGLLLLVVTLLAKLLHEYTFSFSYIAFLMMIVLFPAVIEEMRVSRYSFFHAVLFFSIGIVIAALLAQYFAIFPSISQFIRVDAYSQIVRRCGFYGDPNFYAAQITAAMAGALVLVLKNQKKTQTVILCVLIFLLLYCGLLSASKSFVLVTAGLLLLWFAQLLLLKGRAGLKVIMILVVALAVVYIASSSLFGELIEDIVIRFSNASNLDDLTTHRTEIWASYSDAIFSDMSVLLFGNGLTNIKVNNRGSHNTLVQIVWQCGLLGMPIIAMWIAGFLRDGLSRQYAGRRQLLSSAIVLCGVYLPWMAIDMLFFDEFFLLQAFVICGLRTELITRNGRS